MKKALALDIRDIIEKLQVLHGSREKPASLRVISDIYGVSHQTLGNWAKGCGEHEKLFKFLAVAQKKLGKIK